MRIKVIAFAGLAFALAACGSGEPEAPKDIAGFCKDTKCPDDGNPCTTDCDEAKDKCGHTELAAGTPCEDGSKCTTGETCGASGCKGADVVCDDKKPCTADTCSPATGCVNTAMTGVCDADGTVCTVGDACKDGQCVVGTIKDCDDNNVCTKDSCDAVTGCVNKPADGPCDDKDKCTENDSCDDGKCLAGSKVAIDDKDPCTDDSCEPKGGVVHAHGSALCDDGDKCTAGETCAAGKCAGGSQVKSDDGNPCTNDSCDPKAGVAHAAKEGPCDDGDACTAGDACKEGACAAGAKVAVDDKNPCTIDKCDAKAGVSHDPDNGKTCDDGDACTDADVCADGACKAGAKKVCLDDGSPCTFESCDKLTGCMTTPAPADTKCDDGDKCTDGDTCSAGKCVGGAAKDGKSCSDGNLCKDWSCDKAQGCTWKAVSKGAGCSDDNACTDSDACDGGACIPGTKVECNDNNPCTDDVCDKKDGCKHTPNAIACEDGNKCTAADACKAGACSPGAAKACDDGNECTVDSCDTVSGICGKFNAKDGSACDDGSKCTDASACKTGLCAGSSAVVCNDDGNPCTSDACDDGVGCNYPAQSGGCDADGNVCTVIDACSGGKCVPGSVKICDDKNPCTDDSCDKLKGCLNIANVAKCDDGLMCTEGDSCKDGKCLVNTPKNCSDGNSCTEDKCDAATGCENPKSLDGSVCDDGNACSTGDTCKVGLCKSAGAALFMIKDGGAKEDTYSSVAARPDGGYVAVGLVQQASGVVQAKLTGFGADGSLLFNTTLGAKAGSEHDLRAVMALPKGGYAAVGNGESRAHAIQINESGKVVWETNLPQGNSPLRGMAVRPDGGVTAVGYEGQANGDHGRLVEFTDVGTLKFDLDIGIPVGFKHTELLAVAMAPAGGYWLGGLLHHGGDAGKDARLMRIQNGTILSDTSFGKPATSQIITHVIADNDGVTGVGLSENGPIGGQDSWIVRVDNNYKVLWQRHFGGALNDVLFDIVAANGGGYFAVGRETNPNDVENARGVILRLAGDGAMVWQKPLGLKYSSWSGIALTPAGNIAVAGYFGENSKGARDFLSGICDQYGNCDCAASGTCLTKKPADCDDANPCSLDWCEAGACKHAIGNEGMTCGSNQLCSKGKCVP